jgi:hypothetical protein
VLARRIVGFELLSMVTADRYVMQVKATRQHQQRGIHVGTLLFVRWTSLTPSRTRWGLDGLQWSDGSTPEQLKGHSSVDPLCQSKEISDLESFLRHGNEFHSVGLLQSFSARLQ